MKIKFIFILLCLVFFSCKKEMGKYLYVDGQHILHTSKTCKSISEIRKAKPIMIYPVDSIGTFSVKNFCSTCVSDEQFAFFMKRLDYYIENEPYIKAEPFRKRIYDIMSEKYDMPSFDVFCKHIESDDNRKAVYDDLKEEYDLVSFDAFTRNLLGK